MTAPESPSALLLRAADRLDELAGDATEGPWSNDDPNTRWGDDYAYRLVGGGKILAVFSSEHNGPFNAAYIAAVDPLAGRDFAAMLRAAAVMAEGLPEAADVAVIRTAMDAARKILKGATC